jgi:hypothetical protein
VVGSNGFGIETFEGRRQHAMEWYFEFIRTRRIDVTPIITHRFALDDYREAFMACYRQGNSGAVKVLFDQFAARVRGGPSSSVPGRLPNRSLPPRRSSTPTR